MMQPQQNNPLLCIRFNYALEEPKSFQEAYEYLEKCRDLCDKLGLEGAETESNFYYRLMQAYEDYIFQTPAKSADDWRYKTLIILHDVKRNEIYPDSLYQSLLEQILNFKVAA